MNERAGSRVVFHVNGSIEYNGNTINGDVENLSTKGMLMKTGQHIPVDTEVIVTIYLSGTSSELSLKVKGVVVRNDRSGVAVNFREIEMDSFIHLKNIIEYNTGGDEAILREFEE